jgi:putative N6-adenine-specific DNA methylase
VFCASAPGLERVLAGELAALGLAARAVEGGAEAEGEDAAALACLGARVAETALVRLWEGPAAGLDRARREAARRLPGVPLAVRTGRTATVSADAAGSPLFRRGWRARVGAAPLRETVAAGLLRWAGWDGARPFLDPMCGSGTLAIEAALSAGRRAPGLDRTFAFEGWPGHDPARTAALRARLAAAARPVGVPVLASDRNAGALRLAQKNAAAAGVAAEITFARQDAAAALPPGGPAPAAGARGLCAVNPPWGARLDVGAEEAWRALAALLPRLAGWDLVVLTAGRGRETPLPLAPVDALTVRVGGTAARLLRYAP